MHIKSLTSALGAGACIVACSAPVQAQARAFNIPAGSLKAALDTYGTQSGRPIIYKADQVKGVHSQGFRGAATTKAALDAVLLHTGFSAREDSSGG